MSRRDISSYSIPIWGFFTSSAWMKENNDKLFPVLRDILDCKQEHDYAIFLISGEITPSKQKILKKKMELVRKRLWVISHGNSPLKVYSKDGISLLEEIVPVDFLIPPRRYHNIQEFRSSLFAILQEIEGELNG